VDRRGPFADPFNWSASSYWGASSSTRSKWAISRLIRFLAMSLSQPASTRRSGLPWAPTSSIRRRFQQRYLRIAGNARPASGRTVTRHPTAARSTGFRSLVWVIPGLIVIAPQSSVGSLVTWDQIGPVGVVPLFIIGILILVSAGFGDRCRLAHVWRASAARSEALYNGAKFRPDLFSVRVSDAGYGGAAGVVRCRHLSRG